MRYAVLVWAGLWRKPARTVLTSLSVATAFLLYGALSGTLASFDELLDGITGDSVVLFTTSRVNMAAGLPMAYQSRIERVHGVASVEIEQGLDGYYEDPTNDVGTQVIQVDRRLANPPPDVIVSPEALEAMRQMRTGAIMGKALADKFGWKVGQRLPLATGVVRKDGSNVWMFDVVGTWDTDSTRFASDQIWINFDYFDEARAFGNGMVTAFAVRVADPAQATRVAAEIDALFTNSPNETLTRSVADMIRAEIDQVTNIRLIINVVLSAVLFTLLFLTGNTMMQSTVERIPELAVLKTYGYSDAVIAGMVLIESLLMCVISALVGIALAATLLFPLIASAFQIGSLPMDESVVATGVAIAVVLAGVSALMPAWRAQRLSVVDALAGR